MKYPRLLAVALAVALTAAWTVAQPQDPPPPGTPGAHGQPDGKGMKRQGPHPGKDGNQAKARELLEQVMIARLSGELNLSDEQSVVLMRRFTESRDEKQALGRERTEAMRALRGIVDEQKDESALHACLARLRDVDTKLATQRQRLEETMGADLSPWQKGKLVLFLDQFETELKQMLREARERKNGRPFGGGMPPAPGMGPRPGMNPPGGGRGPVPPADPNGMRPPQEAPEAPRQTPPPPPK